jgi:dTDP-glucose 4,6-dehydratase
MKRVIITGDIGFIGSHVTELFLEHGWKVYGIDKHSYVSNVDMIDVFSRNPNYTHVQADICDLTWIPDAEVIIHTAAESHVGNSETCSKEFIRSNIEGTRNLLELVRHKPGNIQQKPLFFHYSSDEVLGEIKQGSATEESPYNPLNNYAVTKTASEMLIKSYNRTYDLGYIVIRPVNNFGIRQYAEKLIPLSVRLLQTGKKIRLHNRGEPVRSFLSAKDTALATKFLVDLGVRNETYNVSANFEQSNLETVRKVIKSFYGADKDYEKYLDLNYSRSSQDMRYSVDTTKINSLGWQPIYNFDDEIDEIVKYYKENFKW